jgi:hypothetical protein
MFNLKKMVAIVSLLSFGLLFSCLPVQPTSYEISSPEVLTNYSGPVGTALFKIMVASNDTIFSKIAPSARVSISAGSGSAMSTISKALTFNDTSIQGTVTGIPAGNSRIFQVSVYDSLGSKQYYGADTANVLQDTTVNIFITVKRVIGSANINGEILEADPIEYRYYKFIVNTSNIGSTPGAAEDVSILTETHFLKGGVVYPSAGDYTIVSDSSIKAGSVGALFDGNSATDSTGNYMKFSLAPWAWVIDMKQSYTFDSFYLSSWQTYWYKEPSDISIYGSNSSSGPWNLIGAEVFTTVYQSAVVPLMY